MTVFSSVFFIVSPNYYSNFYIFGQRQIVSSDTKTSLILFHNIELQRSTYELRIEWALRTLEFNKNIT